MSTFYAYLNRCICNPGYTLDNSGGNCTDVDECQDAQSCQYGECINLDGGHECKCPDSYELLPSGTGCVDKRTGECFQDFNITYNGKNRSNEWGRKLDFMSIME